MSVAALISSALNLIYPRKCIFCGEISESAVCGGCGGAAEAIEPPCCEKCGRSVSGKTPLCPGCEGADFPFERGGALWPYEGRYSRAVLDLKFNNKTENGRLLGNFCAEDIMKKRLNADINIIVPTPLHSSKMRKRGYNQSEIIAAAIGKRLNIRVDSQSLIRIKKTVPQMDLNPEQRLVNINGSMKVASPEKIKGKNILLIDDIFTTGSTLAECAKELKRSGAQTVVCYCVCVSGAKGSHSTVCT